MSFGKSWALNKCLSNLCIELCILKVALAAIFVIQITGVHFRKVENYRKLEEYNVIYNSRTLPVESFRHGKRWGVFSPVTGRKADPRQAERFP